MGRKELAMMDKYGIASNASLIDQQHHFAPKSPRILISKLIGFQSSSQFPKKKTCH
jgi:hypothetical protein